MHKSRALLCFTIIFGISVVCLFFNFGLFDDDSSLVSSSLKASSLAKINHLTMTSNSEKTVFAKTIYAEARGECEEGQHWVAWVIKNRAAKNRDYWGGDTIEGVCKMVGQFECWIDCDDIYIDDERTYERIRTWSDALYDAPMSKDPTNGCDHYNNPDKEGYPEWTNNVQKVRKIGAHQFYRGF